MPRKKDVDYKALLKMLNDGVPQTEIMEKFGLKTIGQLKSAIADAAMEAGSLPQLVGGRRGRGKAAAKNTAKVGKRGSIIIAKELVDAFGFVQSDEFTVRQTKYGLQLRKAGAPEGGEGEE
jgi:hypothetical protein